MKYLIWKSNSEKDNKDKFLNVLLTNRSFAEIFEGDNPIHPLGGIIKIHQKKYRITKFGKVDDMVEVRVMLETEGVSETA
ncbi:MAG: hypothetical protein ACR2LL_09660 [Nitrosopumilus sp.]